MEPLSRPTSFDELTARGEASGFDRAAGASVERGLAFTPRPTDLIITPYAKCGTTWLQQIVHGLRTRGDMDFDDISRVIPWIEFAHAQGLDLDAEQPGPFRAFKSHLARHQVPKGGRYLVSIRDPKDALVSFFRFMEGWLFETGSIDIAEFAQRRYLDRPEDRTYWYHLASWWERRHDPDILLLSYEGMKADLPGTVRRVADFVGIDLDPDLERIVIDQASLPFMLEHKDRFDDLLMRQLQERLGMLPPGGDSAKVRSGRVGGHRVELPPEVAAELDRVWEERIGQPYGLASYGELRATLEAERAAG
jgi:hypothetical protein